jgi:hypothetical protein
MSPLRVVPTVATAPADPLMSLWVV